MPSMRTNLLRVELAGRYTSYEVDLSCRTSIDSHHLKEIAHFIHKILPQALYSSPNLYSPIPLE